MRRPLILCLAIAATAIGAASAVRSADISPSEIDRLRLEIADLQKRLQAQEAEIERLRKMAGIATQPATRKVAATKPAAPAAPAQDGPGMYRVSAGPGGRFTATVRAKSREDAISQAMKSVARKAMEYDENVEIGTMKVERIGP